MIVDDEHLISIPIDDKSIIINAEGSIWDGKRSIEHQLDIHINDLYLQTDQYSTLDVMNGIYYVMSCRIRGGKMLHLDETLSYRLIKSLISVCSLVTDQHSNKYNRRFPFSSHHVEFREEAKIAFELLLEFIIEVRECRDALGTMDIYEIKYKLKLDKRIMEAAEELATETKTLETETKASEIRTRMDDFTTAIELLVFLTTNYQHFSDWKEFFNPNQITKTRSILEKVGFFDLNKPLISISSSLASSPSPFSFPASSTILHPSTEIKEALEEGEGGGREKGQEINEIKNEMQMGMRFGMGKKRKSLPPPNALYFDRTPQRVFEMFNCNPETGLQEDQVLEYRHHYGTNELPKRPTKSIFIIIFDQMKDFMIILLLITMIISALVDWPHISSTIVLGLVVLFNVVIGSWQEWKTGKSLLVLQKFTTLTAKVLRSGQERIIDSKDLVCGDLVFLGEGDAIPADLRLVKANKLKVVEASLTGESDSICKSTKTIRVKSRRLVITKCEGNAFMGSSVSHGTGQGIVVRTGIHTEIGQINMILAMNDNHGQEKDKEGNKGIGMGIIPNKRNEKRDSGGGQEQQLSSLQKNLNSLGKQLVILAMILCAIVAIVGIAHGHEIMEMLKISVSLGVSVIPEGLVAVMTLTVAIGISRLAKEKVLIRKAQKIEVLGAVTTICVDKTGTITEGRMRVESVKVANKELENICLAMAAGCCTVSLVDGKLIGDNTEIAIVEESKKRGIETLSKTRIFEIPFDSDRRMMSIVYPPNKEIRNMANAIKMTRENGNEIKETINGNGNGKDSKNDTLDNSDFIVLVKGACESVLVKCQYHLNESKIVTRIDKKFIDYIVEAENFLSDQGLRVLAIACKSIDKSTIPSSSFSLFEISPSKNEKNLNSNSNAININIGENGNKNENSHENSEKVDNDNDSQIMEEIIESNLIFIGLIGLLDPPRTDITRVIDECKRAHIKLCMITGDHARTAIAIAKMVGILDFKDFNLDSENRIMKGIELDLLSEEALLALWPFPTVFARVTPQNKLAIVRALRKRGECVIMTGDGVNDAPAIKLADVGIAMGQSGTQLAKDAADIILMNDSFSTIILAIRYGRTIYENLIKFMVYLLSCNSAELWTVITATILNVNVPFSATNILWANLIADIPPSLSLGLERDEQELIAIMNEPPRKRKGILGIREWILILGEGILLAMITIACYLRPWRKIEEHGWSLIERRSEAFFILTGLQLILALFSRSTSKSAFVVGFLGNKWLLFMTGLSFIFLIAGHYIPYLNSSLELVPIREESWIYFTCSAIIVIIGVEMLKFIIRRLPK